MKTNLNNQAGNALFLILIAVALFAALSYAVTQSSRGGANIDREKQKLAQAVSEQCNASVNYAVDKLKLLGRCGEGDISYEINDTSATDKSCHVFEMAGGGATPCGAYLDVDDNCDLEALAIGEKCPDADIVYAGTSGGRLYTTVADQGSFIFGGYGITIEGATSVSDGKANTDILVGLGGHAAAEACRGLGEEWYLPARDELNTLYTNRTAIGGFDESGSYTTGWYWSSWPSPDNLMGVILRFSDGSLGSISRNFVRPVRCVRR